MSAVLVLREVELTLGNFRFRANLELGPGCTGIFGPSGAGKTTLLELIAGLKRADRGTLTFHGETMSDSGHGRWMPPHRRGIGYVPQDLALFPHLDARSNILFGARALDERNRRETLDALAKLLEIEPLLARRVEGLSGGERQRVAIARALAAQPRLLLLDEPFSGLDEDRRESALSYLRRLRDHFSVPMIHVSHRPAEMVALCERVVTLHQGSVVHHGAPLEIFERDDRVAYRVRKPSP